MFFFIKKKTLFQRLQLFCTAKSKKNARQKKKKKKKKNTLNGPSRRPDPLPIPSSGATEFEMRRQIN
jgi:hypothetical protein